MTTSDAHRILELELHLAEAEAIVTRTMALIDRAREELDILVTRLSQQRVVDEHERDPDASPCPFCYGQGVVTTP